MRLVRKTLRNNNIAVESIMKFYQTVPKTCFITYKNVWQGR